MTTQMKFLTHALIAISLIVLCNSQSYSEPANLSQLKSEITTYHDAGLYDKELKATISNAQQYILEKSTQLLSKQPTKKPAVVLDIDETSLSNYQYIIKRDFVGDKTAIHEEILEAKAPAIKETLALYKTLKQHHIAVFFVTGRNESEKKATELNLARAGFSQWDGLYLKPMGYHNPSAVPFKSTARNQISKKGYIIVASIGDQYSDLIGGHALKGFKLPNPFYYLP